MEMLDFMDVSINVRQFKQDTIQEGGYLFEWVGFLEYNGLCVNLEVVQTV